MDVGLATYAFVQWVDDCSLTIEFTGATFSHEFIFCSVTSSLSLSIYSCFSIYIRFSEWKKYVYLYDFVCFYLCTLWSTFTYPYVWKKSEISGLKAVCHFWIAYIWIKFIHYAHSYQMAQMTQTMFLIRIGLWRFYDCCCCCFFI